MQNCPLNAEGVGAQKTRKDFGIRKGIWNASWRKEETWIEQKGAGRAVLWTDHPCGLRVRHVEWYRQQGVPFRPREGDRQGLEEAEIIPWEGAGFVWPWAGGGCVESPRPRTPAGRPRVRLVKIGVVRDPFTFQSLFHCKLFLSTLRRD